MSKECDFCGKKPQVGNLVSHSNIKTKRRFNPNLQRVRHQFADGTVRTLTVCTRCLRSGVVTKPAAAPSRTNLFFVRKAPGCHCNRGFFAMKPRLLRLPAPFAGYCTPSAARVPCRSTGAPSPAPRGSPPTASARK